MTHILNSTAQRKQFQDKGIILCYTTLKSNAIAEKKRGRSGIEPFLSRISLCGIPSPARQGSYVEGAVRGARQVSSGARSRLACPQVPRPCGIHGCSPVMSLKFGYSYSFLTTRLATPWFFFCSAGAQVSIGNARRSPSDVCRAPRTCVSNGVTVPAGHPPRPSRDSHRLSVFGCICGVLCSLCFSSICVLCSFCFSSVSVGCFFGRSVFFRFTESLANLGIFF